MALRAPIRACLIKEPIDGGIVLPATNRRGKSIRCRVTYTPLFDHALDSVEGVILLWTMWMVQKSPLKTALTGGLQPDLSQRRGCD